MLIVGCVRSDGSFTVGVTALEYRFSGIPASLPAGTVTFAVDNRGGENHELVLSRVIGDDPILEVLDRPQWEWDAHLENAGATDAIPPGQGQSLSANLEAGTYAYYCLVTTEAGRPHAFEGMRGTFDVR